MNKKRALNTIVIYDAIVIFPLPLHGHDKIFGIPWNNICRSCGFKGKIRDCSSLYVLVSYFCHKMWKVFFSSFSFSHHCVCVNFIQEWRDLQFNVDSEWQTFEKLLHGRFIKSLSFCQKSTEKLSLKKYFLFTHSFWYLACNTNPGFTSNKPTYYLLDYYDFNIKITALKKFISN